MKKLMMTIGAAMMAALALADGESFGYQGVLCDDKGKPISSQPKTIAFRLYDAAVEGTKLWSRRIAVRTDANGLFNVELSDAQGSVEAEGPTNTLSKVFAATTKKGQTLYIALEVDGSSGEIRPRQKLLATPFSSFAQDGNHASGDFVGMGKATFCGGIDVTGGLYNVMPVGTVMMWYGTRDAVPKGWRICDGSHGTPDMCGLFPVGATTNETTQTDYSWGRTGGLKGVQLSVNEIPSHSHTFVYGVRSKLSATDGHQLIWAPSGKVEGTTETDGGNTADKDTKGNYIGKAHENRPPYRALYFIMRTND